MNTKHLLAAAFLLASPDIATAQINVSSDGSDGVFNPPGNVTIDLAQAIPGAWNDPVLPANAGKGIYDRDKRAIIFKYASVDIAAGRTVSFSNHPSRAAVVWLVNGSVLISGAINLNGGGATGTFYSVPGPGGFRGGPQAGLAVGLGPGGGNGSGRYASVPYGNPTCLPLIGGSGGKGESFNGASAGGGGGGAILIAASSVIQINGSILANGGTPFNSNVGSGGAIRLAANSISGTGSISASPDGRIRLEANTVSGTFLTTPLTSPVFPTIPVTLWPSEDNRFPVVKIVSIDGNPAPVYPTGAPMDVQADVDTTKAVGASSLVVLRTQRFSTSGTVKLRAAGKYSNTAILATAVFQSGTETEALWHATVILPDGFTALQAIATHTP